MKAKWAYTNSSNKIRIEDAGQNFLVFIFFSQLFFSNGLILFFGAFVFGYILINLQRPYKPSVFTIIFIYHFIQISAGIWLSNYLGKDINYRSDNSALAIFLSYLGLMVLMWPIIYFNNKLPDYSLEQLKQFARKIDTRKVFIAYLVAFFITNILSAVAFSFAALTQIIFSLIKIKWFLFILFGYVALLKRSMVRIFLLACALEFISGFFSYFSEFKDVIFFSSFILITLITSIKLKHIIFTVLGIVLVVYLGVFWTTIKGQYREFLNQGSKSQTVQVSETEAFNKLLDLVEQGKEGYHEDATANFLDRLQYTYHFAKTMDNVPSKIPHQYGANWGESLSYALTPRALNPEKPIFEATVKTRKYTGLAYAGHKQGASFSLGYFADGYIDFGMIGMFIPLLILGLIYGTCYFYFLKNSSSNLLFNYAVVGAMFMEFIAFEVDGTKLIGRIYVTIFTFLLLRFFAFPWLESYLKVRNPIKNGTE